jgi:3-methyladenine DNA glycosylase AlkC
VAEALKNQFGPEIPRAIAATIVALHPPFDDAAFMREALHGYEPLGLMQRGRQIAHVLRRYLPQDYGAAAEILIASLGPKLDATESWGMAPFQYLPYSFFIAEFGLEHFELSMRAQYELTQRFSAEFSIRPYLERYREATLARLEQWAGDPSAHVRRLVSEGTRPRLPWASRLREFQEDPRPVLALLELLKDDPALYVRRSVANNLNDIGKDHPEVLAETASRWLHGASEQRRWLVRHALRSAVKRGEAGALAVLGFDGEARVRLMHVSVTPPQVRTGESVVVALDVCNTAKHAQQVLVDLRVLYVKSGGRRSPKVFKLKALDLAPGAGASLSKIVSLAEMTTRRHYPGVHQVEVLLNGKAQALGSFELLAE